MKSRNTLLQALLCLVLVVSFVSPASVVGATPATVVMTDEHLMICSEAERLSSDATFYVPDEYITTEAAVDALTAGDTTTTTKDALAAGETWCFTFYNHLPAVYLYVDPVEIYYVDEDYGPPTPGGMDIDFNEIPELAGLAQLWYAPVPEEPICIQVTRDGDNIYASFEFNHEPTGYDVSAELSGTIIGNTVSFNINYYLPNELQNYSMPLNYSDCMSDMEGTVSYSLPAVLTATYEGTITGDTIQGTFTAAIGGQWARWRYHDKEYSCVVTVLGTYREELIFDGVVEWTFSNLRLSGDFRVGKNQPPVASFQVLGEREGIRFDLNSPMVGQKIIFDASGSYDPDGDMITSYEWDLNGDGIIDHEGKVVDYYVYDRPGIYTVTLYVEDDDGSGASTDQVLDLSLRNGDLLLCRTRQSLVPGFWTHVGIYHEPSGMVVEARLEGVAFYPLADWIYPSATCVKALRVETDQGTRDAAVNFAWGEVGSQYDLLTIFLDRKHSTNWDHLGWYCSELVWAAYLNASNGTINLDPDLLVVSPDEIRQSGFISEVGEHIEEIPPTFGSVIIWGRTRCPVDLEITDPDGLVLSGSQNEIPRAIYAELDIDEDGDLDDAFVIPECKIGDYSIRVIPEPGALPTDTYSLEVTANGQTIVLAEDVQISDIPSEPYFIGAEVNSPPNTPSNPSPANHASGVPTNSDLSWAGGDSDAGYTVTYDVYFGTSETPPLKATIGPYPATQSSITYDPGTLVDGTTYYWQIVARDNHGIAREGPVWDFTTGQPGPTVAWNCPLGGQALIAPNPGKGRPYLSVPAACTDITVSAGAALWGIYYLVETGPDAGTWKWYVPGFASSTLTQLEPDELYWVVVSAPCTLTIPQG